MKVNGFNFLSIQRTALWISGGRECEFTRTDDRPPQRRWHGAKRRRGESG